MKIFMFKMKKEKGQGIRSCGSNGSNKYLGRDHLISRAGGLVFFLATSYFFCTTSYFFKSKLQQVFDFLKNNTFKPEKCKRKQHTE